MPSTPELTIRAMSPGDWPAVERIYADGIATGNATFETEPPAWADFDTSKLAEHRLVADADGRVVGWAAAIAVSDRCTYAGVIEHSVYVDLSTQGRGVGRALLDAFIISTEAAGIWTILSGIFPENHASLALHQHAGFRIIGTRERLGQHHGRWRDVLMLERRSRDVGA